MGANKSRVRPLHDPKKSSRLKNSSSSSRTGGGSNPSLHNDDINNNTDREVTCTIEGTQVAVLQDRENRIRTRVVAPPPSVDTETNKFMQIVDVVSGETLGLVALPNAAPRPRRQPEYEIEEQEYYERAGQLPPHMLVPHMSNHNINNNNNGSNVGEEVWDITKELDKLLSELAASRTPSAPGTPTKQQDDDDDVCGGDRGGLERNRSGSGDPSTVATATTTVQHPFSVSTQKEVTATKIYHEDPHLIDGGLHQHHGPTSGGGNTVTDTHRSDLVGVIDG
eukprot:PhM_4_TR12984/c0_g1_i1/m.21129